MQASTMSSGTITSMFQMRKRRFPGDPSVEAVRPNRTKVVDRATPHSVISKSPSPIAHSPKIRKSPRDTSMRFLCSQSDSQPEISWNCNSPEFHKPTTRRRNHQESNSYNNDMLSLIHNTFNTTPLKKKDEKKSSLLALWMAKTEENVSYLPIRDQSTSSGHKSQAVKPHVGMELEQLVTKLKNEKDLRPHPVNSLPQLGTKSINHSEGLKIIGSLPSTSSEADRQSHGMERNIIKHITPTLHLDDGVKSKAKYASDANSSDTWSDEDLFNDKDFIAQTQKVMTDHLVLNNSQLPTQRVIISQETIGLDDALRHNPPVDVPNSSRDELNFIPLFSNLKHSAEISVAGPSKLTATLQEQSKQEDVKLAELWDSDDGIEAVMCTLGDLQNKDDSLDYLMNCDTQLYGASNQSSSSCNSFTANLLAPTQLLEVAERPSMEKQLHEGMQKSTGQFHPLSFKEKIIKTKMRSVPSELSSEAVTCPSKPSLASKTLLEGLIPSKTIPPKANCRRYTAEEIERKKHEALERRRQKFDQIKSSTRCQVIYSQIMPRNLK